MFRVFYSFNDDNKYYQLIFTNEELVSCVQFLKQHKFTLCKSMIISPNNRRITFTNNDDMIFSQLSC